MTVTAPVAGDVVHREVLVRGIRVHVVEAGEGPPLVLQHGYPQHWRCWEEVIPLLATEFRVICPDMRGFGQSEAPGWGYAKEDLAQDLLAVCDALRVEEFSLVGHDWGGVVAFLAALRAQHRVRRLVLLNTAHLFWRGDRQHLWALRGFWYMPFVAAPVIGPRLMQARRFKELVLGWAHPGGPPWSDELWESFAFDHPARAQAGRRLYATFLRRELPRVLRGYYLTERLSVPTLILHGDADRAVRKELHAGWEGHIDEVRVEHLAGVGHFAAEEHPERVAAAIAEFVRPAVAQER